MQNRVILLLILLIGADIFVFGGLFLWAYDGFVIAYADRPWVGPSRIAMTAILAVLALTLQAFLANRLAR